MILLSNIPLAATVAGLMSVNVMGAVRSIVQRVMSMSACPSPLIPPLPKSGTFVWTQLSGGQMT